MNRIRNTIEDASKLIADMGSTIAFVESATAGKLAFEFSLTQYSGAILKGGIVCYDACIKEDVLGVSKEIIANYTPESTEVTKEMAMKLKKMMQSDIVVSVTGLTSSGGSERPGKPVGTMFYCILWNNQIIERKKIFTGSPIEIVNLAIEHIAKTLLLTLIEKSETDH